VEDVLALQDELGKTIVDEISSYLALSFNASCGEG